jgi:tripartite-type tricarboxylate transporter receptor subunit TctC
MQKFYDIMPTLHFCFYAVRFPLISRRDHFLEDSAMKSRMWLSKLCPLAVLVAFATTGPGIKAEDFPSHPVKLIVQAPGGSSLDVIGRILADQFASLWGQQVLVLNQPGAGGTIAARAAVTAQPDGYTLFMPATSIFVSMPELYRDLAFNVSRDLVPAGLVGEQPMAIAVNSSLAVNSIEELIAYSKKQREGINWAAIGGVAGLPHLTGELFRIRSGGKLTSIPYAGTPQAANDILGGRVQMIMESLPSLQGLVAGGELKLLAFASDKRLPEFPAVPTVGETLPGFLAMGWFALVAPARTDPAIVNKLSRDLGKAVASPELNKKFVDIGTYTRPMSAAETREFIDSQQEMWKPVLRQLDLKPQ